MMHDAYATMVMHVSILLTTIAGFIYSWMREGRRHRWQQEENRQMREEMQAVVTEVKNGRAKA